MAQPLTKEQAPLGASCKPSYLTWPLHAELSLPGLVVGLLFPCTLRSEHLPQSLSEPGLQLSRQRPARMLRGLQAERRPGQ